MRHTRQSVPARARSLLRRLSRRQRDLIAVARSVGDRRRVSVYLVGGPVRDIILGRRSGDLDLTVVGDAVGYAKAFAAHLRAQVTTHPQFGTATVVFRDGVRVDVAAARRERYVHPAALPQVFPGTIHDDLFRRDFSVNAMAVQIAPRDGGLLDPFGGLEDLDKGVLRVLHAESYRDDPTRIFRGARYAARYRFRFSPRDRELIRGALAGGVLKRLSGDRLFRELKLVLNESAPEAALKILQSRRVLKALDPALAVDRNMINQMRRVRRAWGEYHRLEISSKPSLWRVCLLVLLASIPVRVRQRVGGHLGLKGPPLDALLGELKDLAILQAQLRTPSLRITRLRHLLDGASADLYILLWASGVRRVRDRVKRYLTRVRSVKPVLTGRDLKRFGFPPGPTYRRIFDVLLAGRLEGRIRSRQDEVAFLRRRFGRPR